MSGEVVLTRSGTGCQSAGRRYKGILAEDEGIYFCIHESTNLVRFDVRVHIAMSELHNQTVDVVHA